MGDSPNQTGVPASLADEIAEYFVTAVFNDDYGHPCYDGLGEFVMSHPAVVSALAARKLADQKIIRA